MSDWDVTPRAARRLRTFGRLDALDDLVVDTTEGSHGGASTDGDVPGGDPEQHTSIWDRRRQQRTDPDAVDIGLETNHAWWAQRENLELLVNPKKRGAAARARRAAEAAFAPPSSRSSAAHAPRASSTTTAGSTSSPWDPSQVYSWAAEASGDAAGADSRTEEPPAPAATATPWDVLGLTSDASWADVARRHKQLAKQHHPDRHGTADPDARNQAEARMSEINAAFSDLRRIYRLTDGL